MKPPAGPLGTHTGAATPFPGTSGRVAFPPNWPLRVLWLAFVLYIVYAASRLEFTGERVLAGLQHGATFVLRLFPPDFSRWALLLKGMIESLQIAVIASVLGVVISLPISLFAARNLMPAWLSWPARLIMVLCRSFHPTIVAIFCVKAVGFGALAGIIALTVASVGFLGKLFSEALEESHRGSIEALEAVGAPLASQITKGYWPQVKPAFWSIVLFRWDINVRESAVLGLVGAGGVGMVLDTAMNVFQWDRVAMILLAIFVVVILAELATTQIRKRII